MNKLENWHEQKRLYFYPKIFEHLPITSENWKDYQLEFFNDNRKINWLARIAPLVTIIILLLFTAQIKKI